MPGLKLISEPSVSREAADASNPHVSLSRSEIRRFHSGQGASTQLMKRSSLHEVASNGNALSSPSVEFALDDEIARPPGSEANERLGVRSRVLICL